MATPLDELRELPTSSGRVAATWLGQAGFALRSGQTTVLLDPFLSPHQGRRYESALPAASATGVDLVFCSHEHIDHLDAGSAPAIATASPGATFVVPAPIVDMVTEAGVAEERVLGVQPGETHELDGITVRPVPARHGVTMADAYGFGEELSGGLIRFVGFVLEMDGVRLYHAGDTIHYEGMEATVGALRPHVSLLPINGRHADREARGIVGNLDEREAAWLAAAIGSETLIPMHHDLFTGNLGSAADVVEAAEEEGRAVTVLVPPRETPFVVVAGRER
ncbi:MAG: MBL fold metallo-hydrolase [Actinobacteria bacterium]|nr:MAG: MBL fold metallo-hydrolase [Actinomycetota bacterium]